MPDLTLREIVAAVFLVALVLLGLDDYRLRADVAETAASLKVSEASNTALMAGVEDQNAAIIALSTKANEAEARVAEAEAAANIVAAQRDAAAAELVAWQRKPNEGECDAAKRLVMEYRK